MMTIRPIVWTLTAGETTATLSAPDASSGLGWTLLWFSPRPAGDTASPIQHVRMPTELTPAGAQRRASALLAALEAHRRAGGPDDQVQAILADISRPVSWSIPLTPPPVTP